MKFLLSFFSLFLFAFTVQAQIQSVVSSYDLRFADKRIDYCTPTPTFCTEIQIKAADGAEDFLVGSHTLFFNYNSNSINFLSYTSLNFNDETECVAIPDVLSFFPYDTFAYSYSESLGLGQFNLTTILEGFWSGHECPIITDSQWEDIGTICFTIENDTQTANLSFDKTNSVLNNGSEEAIHNPAIFDTYDDYPVKNAHFSVLLEGSYETTSNIMNTNLLNDGLVPTSQPFNRSPWNYAGTESVASANDFPADVVDWVLIEARDIDDNSIILEQKAAFLLANGEILDAAPSVCSGIQFNNISFYARYFFSIKTRNHLAIMGEKQLYIPNPRPYDFTLPSNVVGGETQLKMFENGVFALKAGDINSDGRINLNDINAYYDECSALNEYLDSDVNFNGTTSVADFNLFPSAAVIGAVQVQY